MINSEYGEAVGQLLQLDNEMDQFDYLWMLALQSPGMPDAEKTEEARVAACDSRLWCRVEEREGQVSMRVDSDSLFVKGLALLLKTETERRDRTQLVTKPLMLSDDLYARGIMDAKRRDGMREMQDRVYCMALRLAGK